MPAPSHETHQGRVNAYPESANDLFEPPGDTRSFFERNDSLIEVALVLAAIVVAAGGLLALRRRTAGEET